MTNRIEITKYEAELLRAHRIAVRVSDHEDGTFGYSTLETKKALRLLFPDEHTVSIDVEYTDTFGGEPNYSWVRRASLVLPKDLSDAAIMRRAKAAVGLTGVRGRSEHTGDAWAFRPAGSCSIMFATVNYL